MTMNGGTFPRRDGCNSNRAADMFGFGWSFTSDPFYAALSPQSGGVTVALRRAAS
jgi:hypothetical protein